MFSVSSVLLLKGSLKHLAKYRCKHGISRITEVNGNMLITVDSFVMGDQENSKNWLARAGEKPASIICFNLTS